MRIGSFRWWFENRQTGAITIAQAPNPALLVAVGGWAVGALFGATPGTIGRVVSTIGFVWWSGDEIVRGVNPWRRLLGAGVLVWQVIGFVS